MSENISILLSGLIAFLISGSELLFGTYKNNHTIVLKKFRYLLGYSLLFGLFASIITWMVYQGQFKINEFEIYKSTILVSIIIGIAIKSIVRINIYTLTIENRKIHIGPKIIVELLEDFILRKLQDDVDVVLIKEIKVYEQILKKKTLREMDECIDSIMPTGFNMIKRRSYMKEVTQLKKPFDKCRYIATNFGINRLQMLDNID